MKRIQCLLVICLLALAVFAQETAVQDEIEQEEFLVVDSMPEFVGGQKALFAFLNKNVHYPQEAKANGIQGKTICQFVIDKDGSVTDVSVARSSGNELLDAEAVRVISSMPNWKPGVQRGKRVRVKYTVPVNFRLSSGGTTTASPPASEEKATSASAQSSKPILTTVTSYESEGDRLFMAGQYTDAEAFYRKALTDSKNTKALTDKIDVAVKCQNLIRLAKLAEDAASVQSINKYEEAAQLYMELFSYHGLPAYEARANLLLKKARGFTAMDYKSEGDRLFQKELYSEAAKKYTQARNQMDVANYAQEELERAVTCSNLLDMALREEDEAMETMDANRFRAAGKLYMELYKHHELPKYLKKAKEMQSHTPDREEKKEYPQFPGGEEGLFKYIEERTHSSMPDGFMAEQVVVNCRFIVSENGDVTSVEVVEPCDDDSLNNTARQIVESMPRWNPGKRNDVPSSFSYILPITFLIYSESYVDLGLPSGLKWANMNLGARAPYEVGNHYQWGCLETAYVSTWLNYCHGRYNALNKYCTDSKFGSMDNLCVLETQDDVANLILGSGWRLPTRQEALELWNCCSRTWETHGVISGYRLRGPNGNSIFLPANGCFDKDGKPQGVNVDLYYWTSTLSQENNNSAYALITQQKKGLAGVYCGKNTRPMVLGVRPVHP